MINLTTYSKIIFPSQIDVKCSSYDKNFASVFISPLQKGFGNTIGNSLRRILLSSIRGTVFSSIKFSNLSFEYSTIPGILQDVSEICFNIRKLSLISSQESGTVYLKAKGPKKVYASDIITSNLLDIVDKENSFLFEITSNQEVNIELNFESGIGNEFINNENNNSNINFGEILLDKHFSPIKNVEIEISNTRIGSNTDYDKLEIKIQTNGTISPSDAIKNACIILQTFMNIISNTNEKIEIINKEEKLQSEVTDHFNTALLIPLKNIEFSARVYNWFISNNLEYLIDLVKLTEDFILGAPNMGKKSTSEIKDILNTYGLSLGMNLDKYSNMTIEELQSKYSSKKNIENLSTT